MLITARCRAVATSRPTPSPQTQVDSGNGDTIECTNSEHMMHHKCTHRKSRKPCECNFKGPTTGQPKE